MFHFLVTPWIVFDGLLLWSLVGVLSVLTLVTMEFEKPGWCTFLIIAALGIFEFYTNYHPVTFALQHPIDALVVVAIYFATGTLWMVIKWISHVYIVRDKFSEFKKQYGDINDRQLFYAKASNAFGYSIPLKVSNHKSELYMWWLVWPLSLVWTIINDPIKRIWHFVYHQFGDVLQRISDRAFKID